MSFSSTYYSASGQKDLRIGRSSSWSRHDYQEVQEARWTGGGYVCLQPFWATRRTPLPPKRSSLVRVLRRGGRLPMVGGCRGRGSLPGEGHGFSPQVGRTSAAIRSMGGNSNQLQKSRCPPSRKAAGWGADHPESDRRSIGKSHQNRIDPKTKLTTHLRSAVGRISRGRGQLPWA